MTKNSSSPLLEDNRVTKWLHKKHKHWLLTEGIRIENATGDTCVIDEKTTQAGIKLLALYRVPPELSREDIYKPCGCIVYVRSSLLESAYDVQDDQNVPEPHICAKHEKDLSAYYKLMEDKHPN